MDIVHAECLDRSTQGMHVFALVSMQLHIHRREVFGQLPPFPFAFFARCSHVCVIFRSTSLKADSEFHDTQVIDPCLFFASYTRFRHVEQRLGCWAGQSLFCLLGLHEASLFVGSSFWDERMDGRKDWHDRIVVHFCFAKDEQVRS